VWLDDSNRWYKQMVGSKERIYFVPNQTIVV